MRQGISFILLCCVVLTGLQCGSLFPTTFDRVDADRIRVLDFVYEPAEAAPGDTVTVRAMFAGAGDTLQPADIAWDVSFRVLSNLYGIDTALDVQQMDLISYEQSYFSPTTSCLVLRFKIPDNVVYTSPMIPDDWQSIIPNQNSDAIPDAIAGLDKAGFIAVVEQFSLLAEQWGDLFVRCTTSQDTTALVDSLATDPMYSLYAQNLQTYIPAVLQLLTVKIRLFAEIKGAYRVRSDYVIRYNNRFKDIPTSKVFVNTNPVIDSIGIYSVNKEGLLEFYPEDGKFEYTFQRLYGEADSLLVASIPDSQRVITIDKGYSYFIVGFTQQPDRALTIDSAIYNGSPVQEVLFANFFFQLPESETKGVSAYDFMNIVNGGNLSASLYPSLDSRVTSATIWLQVYDFLLNEINRPRASSLREVQATFRYTQAYLDAVKKKKK